MAMKRWMWQGKETQESIRKTGSKWVGLHAQDNLGSLPACNLFWNLILQIKAGTVLSIWLRKFTIAVSKLWLLWHACYVLAFFSFFACQHNYCYVDMLLLTLLARCHGHAPKNCPNVLSCNHDNSLKMDSRSETFILCAKVCKFCSCQAGIQSHLSFSLLVDPVSELDHLCINTGTVQPRAALTPAHDPSQEPPPASLQTHQRTSWVTLRDANTDERNK